MGFAFTHLLAGWIPGKVVESTRRKPISQFAWGALIFGAILPDIDLLFQWLMGIPLHRTVTHSLFFVFFIGALVYLVFCWLQKTKMVLTHTIEFISPTSVSLGIMAGIFIHIIVDCITLPGTQVLWPLPIWFAWPDFFTLSVPLGEHLAGQFSFPYLLFDTGMGVAWIGYLYWQGRLTF